MPSWRVFYVENWCRIGAFGALFGVVKSDDDRQLQSNQAFSPSASSSFLPMGFMVGMTGAAPRRGRFCNADGRCGQENRPEKMVRICVCMSVEQIWSRMEHRIKDDSTGPQSWQTRSFSVPWWHRRRCSWWLIHLHDQEYPESL